MRPPLSRETLEIAAADDIETLPEPERTALQQTLSEIHFDADGNAVQVDIDALFQERPAIGKRAGIHPKTGEPIDLPIPHPAQQFATSHVNVLIPTDSSQR